MSYQIKQSSTAYPLVFFMTDSTDHLTGKTGLTCTVTLSKSGGSFASPSGAVTEIANGWYKVAGNVTDTATLGPLILHATGTSADATDMIFEVIAFDPQDSVRQGLTGLANAVPGATGGLFIAGTNAATTVTTALTTTFTGNLTGSVGSVSGAVGSVTGNIGGHVDGNVVGNVNGNVVGSTGSVTGAVGSVTGNVGGNVNGTVAGVVGNVVGNVTGSVNSLVTVGSLATGAAQSSQTSLISAIKTQTDKLAFTVTNQIDANIQSINDVTLIGNGQSGTEFDV